MYYTTFQDIIAHWIGTMHRHSFNMLTLGISFTVITGNFIISELSSQRYVSFMCACIYIFPVPLFSLQSRPVSMFLGVFSSWCTVFCSAHFPFPSVFLFGPYNFKREEGTECLRNLWISALLQMLLVFSSVIQRGDVSRRSEIRSTLRLSWEGNTEMVRNETGLSISIGFFSLSTTCGSVLQ
jgi:hypothetical protein